MDWGPNEAINGEEQSNEVQHQLSISEKSGQDCAEKKADEQSKKDLKNLQKKKSSKKMKNKVRFFRHFPLQKYRFKMKSFDFSRAKF